MPTHSIDYLNARKAAKPASGGKTYARTINLADETARFNDLNPFRQIQERAHARFAEQRKIIAEFRARWKAGIYTAADLAENEIPF